MSKLRARNINYFKLQVMLIRRYNYNLLYMKKKNVVITNKVNYIHNSAQHYRSICDIFTFAVNYVDWQSSV